MGTPRQVGEFLPTRRMMGAAKNPMDIATIVSIYPRDFVEKRETMFPGIFHVAGGSIEKPGISHIDASSYWRDIDIEQPLIEIPVSATAIAQSIVTDYCNGLLACDMNQNMPGLFFVNGKFDRAEIKAKYGLQLAAAVLKQNSWYNILVKLADSLWARTNNNPLAIWEEMRLAARELGIEKPWLKDFQMAEMVKCFACGNLRNPEFPICSTCKNVDMSHPRAKDIKIAVM